ncbi:hypothetical protein DL93DRAFT_383527 [Clavulina sp. PMI_390]|nr:hypothetical protein DL93DRAFT_383527 [Clavulina sp. PMI_390]
MGSKFKPSEPPSPGPSGPGVERERRGLFGGKGTDAAAPASAADGSSDWRSGPRRVTSQGGSLRGSPTSTPPTPQRKKLELLPRGAGSPAAESPSPLSSPRMATANVNKPSPFGAAKPIDASNRDKEVEEKIEQDRARTAAAAKEKESQPRSGFSRASNPNSPLPTTARSLAVSPRSTPNSLPPSQVTSPTSTAPPTPAAKKEFAANAGAIRPKFSFAAAAGKTGKADEEATAGDAEVTQVADQVAEVTL